MLGDAGSIASLVGVVVSLLGLSFAIVQLAKLRGETKAAKEAAEATQRAIGRELVITELTRLNGMIQALKEIHLQGDRTRALAQYTGIVESLLDVRRRHPGLSE